MLKSKIHIPTYADLSGVNVTLLLRIATKSLSNILCDMWLGFDVHIKKSFLLLTNFTSILFIKFSIVLPYIALFINF